jgi:arginyl-tRNA synthetase
LEKKDLSILLKYCFSISSSFNSFCSKKKSQFKENPNFYFGIVEIYRQVLRNALKVLSIDLVKIH